MKKTMNALLTLSVFVLATALQANAFDNNYTIVEGGQKMRIFQAIQKTGGSVIVNFQKTFDEQVSSLTEHIETIRKGPEKTPVELSLGLLDILETPFIPSVELPGIGLVGDINYVKVKGLDELLDNWLLKSSNQIYLYCNRNLALSICVLGVEAVEFSYDCHSKVQRVSVQQFAPFVIQEHEKNSFELVGQDVTGTIKRSEKSVEALRQLPKNILDAVIENCGDAYVRAY